MTVWLTQVCHYCCCMCTVNHLDLPNTDSTVVITNFEHKNEFYDQETSNLVRMHILELMFSAYINARLLCQYPSLRLTKTQPQRKMASIIN